MFLESLIYYNIIQTTFTLNDWSIYKEIWSHVILFNIYTNALNLFNRTEIAYVKIFTACALFWERTMKKND